MIRLEEYITAEPIGKIMDKLSEKTLSYEKDREAVNSLILNFVIKYLAAYLEISLLLEPRKLKQEISLIVDFTVLCARSQYEEAGDVDTVSQGADNYPLRCLYDIRQTAAIFKEIVFSGQFLKEKSFFGLDLGSGTGILSVALILATRRKGIKKIRCVGVERSIVAVERSRKVIKLLGLSEEIEFVCGDLLKPGLLRKVMKGAVSSHSALRTPHLSFWVSETISMAIPKIDLVKPDFGLVFHEKGKRKKELRSDPFVEVFQETVRLIPDFVENVKEGKTAMFPDFISGLYAPDAKRSKINLKTGLGNPLLLEQIGQEFEGYEDLGNKHRRWAKEEDYA